MEITHLREFLELSKVLNYGVAADNLFISQPALTKHIKNLEKELGAELFSRTSRSVKLTDFGRKYIKHAEALLDCYDKSERWCSEYIKRNNQSIRIGLPESLMLYEINEHLHLFTQKYPEYKVDSAEHTTIELLNKFHKGKFNIILTGIQLEPKEDSVDFEYLPVATGEVKVCLNSRHPLAGKSSISAEELKSERIVLPPNNTLFQKYIEEYFAEHLGYEKDFMFSSYSIAKTLAESGSCIAILQEEALREPLDKSLTVASLAPTIKYSRGLGYRASGMTQAEMDYIEFVREAISGVEP